MALSLGSSVASKVYLGATEVALAYLGATQVYTSSAFSAEAQDYFNRLDTAGDTTYVDYKQPLANYIDSLVALGGAYWDDMESAASFVGVGIQGVTVPLRNGMPTLTNNNFVAADLNQLTGLEGDASLKYLSTGALDNSTLQDDVSLSVWVTNNVPVDNLYWVGSQRLAQRSAANNTGLKFSARTTSSSFVNPSPDLVDGFIGQTRTVGTDFDWFINTNSGNFVKASTAPLGLAISVFAYGAGLSKNASRIATYHYGPALNLATLQGLQETLLNEVAVAAGLAAAENYFSRLDAAGDTTYVAYKQPLTNYITSLVELGGAYWDDMVSATSFVGVGIQGITVPLRDGMTVPTNNNFVVGDLDQLTGLKGDGTTKYINTGALSSTLGINNHSLSVYLTADREAGGNRYISGANARLTLLGNVTGFRARSASTTLYTLGSSTAVGELVGISRDNSADFDWSYETFGTQLNTSTDFGNVTSIKVFADEGGNNLTAARLATYHIGPALNLATLEGLQDTLITEIAATFNTLVYQSDFANGATEYTPVRVTAVAPDSPDASTNVISLTPTVDTANHYIRLTTSNVNTSDTYLTKFDVFIAAGQAFDGIQVLDWIGPTKFAKTLAGSELGQWVSVSFLTTYPDYGQPAIYLTNAGSVSFVGNNSDVAYIRNLEILEQS